MVAFIQILISMGRFLMERKTSIRAQAKGQETTVVMNIKVLEFWIIEDPWGSRG